MAAGKSLRWMREKLRYEIHDMAQSPNRASGDEWLDQCLRRVYETLWDEHDWPHLKVLRLKSLYAGQRYYDFPSDLNSSRIKDVFVKENGRSKPIERTICVDDYNHYDSESDQRHDCVHKWDFCESQQIEIWPIINNDDCQLVVEGYLEFKPLVSQDDTVSIDATVIVLYAAAEILAGRNHNDAGIKLATAETRLESLKDGFSRSSKRLVLGGGI